MGAVAPAAQAQPPMAETPDEQLDRILKALEAMPEHLKQADPKTYPDYEKAIEPYLEGLTTVVTPSDGSGANPDFHFVNCVASISGFIATNGFPALRIISWIQTSIKLWGGVNGIRLALKTGEAAIAIGPDAATILSSLLGIQGIIKWCFS